MERSGPSSSAQGPVGVPSRHPSEAAPFATSPTPCQKQEDAQSHLGLLSLPPPKLTTTSADIDELENSGFHPSPTYACKDDRAHTVAFVCREDGHHR